jgi:hypothetical protein
MSSTGQSVHYQGPLDRQGLLSYSRRTGVQISFAMSAASQLGYHPVQFTAEVKKPANADRKIEVSFNGGGWYSRGKNMTVRQAMTLKAGDASAKMTMLVPQFQDWQMLGWKVWVDGLEDDQLELEMMGMMQQASNFAMSVLIASPDVRQWEAQMAFQTIGSGACFIRSMRPAELPEDWIAFSTVDVVVLMASDLPQLAARHPRQCEALLRWVRAGGNLFLFDAGSQWEELPGVERTLGLRATSTDDGEADDDDIDSAIERRGWRFVPFGERAVEPLEGALHLSGYDLGASTAAGPPGSESAPDIALERPSQPIPRVPVETSRGRFTVRAHGIGTVTAFIADSLSPTAGSDVHDIQRSLLNPRLNSAGRYGNNPAEANPEFNNLLIPGVGVAPVGQFQFLITLFVLAIGPLNYWWLKRRKKLPMLLFTVPAAAAGVTLLLLSYGVLADGLAVRVRARSFTTLDQRAKESATWGRISYYAGIDPRGGLTLPRDTIVFPILSSWSIGRFNQGPTVERGMVWDDEQRLARNWLASRTPTQYLSINSRPTSKRLDLRKRPNGLEIVNRLEATVSHLVVQDHEGKMYWCEDLPPGQGRIVPVTTRNDVSRRLRDVFTDNFPEFPPGAQPLSYGRGSYYGVTLSQNLAESQLEAINSPVVQAWTNGSYIAVTDRGIELELGIDDVTEEASFHVIRGAW